MISLSVMRRYWLWPTDAIRAYFGTDSHGDPILMGCFLAVLVHTVPIDVWCRLRRCLALSLPLVFVLLLGSIVLSQPNAESPLLAALCSAILILNVTVAANPVALSIFEFAPLIWFGKISYGLYLWHSISDMYLLKDGWIESAPIRALIGLGLAMISYYLIELPVLRLKSRFGEVNPRR